MIEQFETENTDYFSVAGRSALVAGGAYAAYDTFREMQGSKPVNPSNTTYRSKLGRLRNLRTKADRKLDISTGESFTKILGNTRELRNQQRLQYKELQNTELLSNMGYKSRGALSKELDQFQSILNKQGFSGIQIKYKQVGNHVGEIRIQGRYGGQTHFFKVNPVSNEGTVLIGDNLQNKYVARGILDPSSIADDISKSKLKVMDSDVALLRRYASEIGDIKKGVVNPLDLYKKVQDTILFDEGGAGGVGLNNSVGLLRREQVVVDAFGDKSTTGRASLMRQLTSIEGWQSGSAAQFSKGILNSPDSLLSNMIPGSAQSPTSYQLLRQSAFDSSVKPAADWFGGKNVGAGEFTYAYVKDKELLQKALSHLKAGVGEIAPEEMIMNKSRNFMVKNQIYNTKINLDYLSTPSSAGLLTKVKDRLGLSSMEELSKILTSPQGLASLGPEALSKLDFDINEDYKKLIDDRTNLLNRYKQMKSAKGLSSAERAIDRATFLDQIRANRKAIKEYEAFAVSEDMAYSSKLPAKDIQNKIVNMTVDANNQLSISMESSYRFGVGSKSFGAAKSTVKAEADTSRILAYMEMLSVDPKSNPADYPDQLASVMEKFKDVDFIGVESPVKIVDGGMEARRIPSAVSGYISTAIAEGRTEELAKLGVENKNGVYTLASGDGRTLISKIQELHPDKSMEELFQGTQRGASGIHVSKAILSSDIHASQAGIGKAGTTTERGMYYLESMGLNKFTDDVYSRMLRESDTFKQIKILEDAKTISQSVTANSIIDETDALFNINLEERAKKISQLGGRDTLMVELGKKVAGIDRVAIHSQADLAPYIGQQIGSESGMTALDRATKELIEAAKTGGASDEVLEIKAQRYKNELGIVKDSLTSSIAKGKVKGSMYGQAVSSIVGLDNASEQLAKKMGLGDVRAPVIAMTKEDIRSRFGAESLKKAMAGELFGVVTREPIEGVHSVMPTQILAAEALQGGKLSTDLGDMSGRVFLAQSDMMRKSLMVDFDKDTLSVIAAQSEEATQQIKSFMGLSGEQSEVGREFYKSIRRMTHLNPKGKVPVNALSTVDSELNAIISAQKHLEKGSIGIFSNEFKNIHVGLREQLAQGGKASQYFAGEDFAHVFVENILKAKHQSKEAILKNEAMETLDILNMRGKYASANTEARALRLQEIFDQLNFANPESGAEIRGERRQLRRQSSAVAAAKQTTADIADLAGGFGVGDTAKAAVQNTSEVAEMSDEAKLAYAEVSNLSNIKNLLGAHSTGRSLAKSDYLYGAMLLEGKTTSKLDDAVFTAKAFFNTGLGKITKYAIAPAAIIGFASSIFSTPNILKKSSEKHAESDPEQETISAPKTIFAIPESKVDNVLIKGRANARTDFESLHAVGTAAGGNYNSSVSDMRSKPDKYRLQEMIDKGY